MRRRPHLEAAFDRFNKAMQRPEAQRFFAELRAKRPPELDEQWPAIRSYLDGDAEPLRAFVKKHVGAALEQASSSYVFPALEGKDIGGLDEWETWEFIKHHRTRFKARGAVKSSKRVRQQVRQYESVRGALYNLAGYYTKSSEQVLSDKIEEAVCSDGAPAQPDLELVRAIVNRIRRESTQKRKRYLQTDPLVGIEGRLPDSSARREVDSFEALDHLQRLAEAAALSRQTTPTAQELEAFTMAVYMTHKEAAALRGKSETQNKQEAYRAARKYRRAAGL
jgi:hypothetical protein